MGELIKKNSGFLYWVLVPSLLLVTSVFGVNLVSRPGMGQAAPTCSVAADCNSIDPSPCKQYTCGPNSQCLPAGINLGTSLCGQCGQCGNGVCEPSLGETSLCIGPGKDCFFALGPVCATTSPCSGATRDFCCPGSQCSSNPSDSLFDIDCACCGDGAVTSQNGEECDPAVNSGQCTDTQTNQSGTCDNQCQCTPNPFCGDGVITSPETCEPPNTATCNANCQTIVVQQCGNGIVEGTEQCEGTTCSVTQSDGSVIPGVCQNCQCLPECVTEGSGCGNNGGTQGPCFAGTGGTGGSSLIPPPVHPTVLAQWIAAFGLPGAVFTGLRMKRKKTSQGD